MLVTEDAEENKTELEPWKQVNNCRKLISVRSPVVRNVQHFEKLTEEPHEMCTLTHQISPNLSIVVQNCMQKKRENCNQPMGTKCEENK
jgi:hypothetical protein